MKNLRRKEDEEKGREILVKKICGFVLDGDNGRETCPKINGRACRRN